MSSNPPANGVYYIRSTIIGAGVVNGRSEPRTTPHPEGTEGHWIRIEYDNGLLVDYRHLRDRPTLANPTRVSHTTQVGFTGNTGATVSSSTGHLHLSVREKNSSNNWVYWNPTTYLPNGTLTGNVDYTRRSL